MPTPNLALPYISQGQAQKEVTHNEALNLLDAVVQLAVLDRDLAAPPGLPAQGARYLVATGATGAWAGHANQIAVFLDGGWTFFAPSSGWLAWVIDEAALLAWNGSAWVDALAAVAAIQNLGRLGILTTADTTNRLAVKANSALFSHDDVTPGTGDIRLTLNKSAAAKDASFTFQDAFSTRALFGLLGDDNFTIKVSQDGSTFKTAIVIDKATGHIGINCSPDANNWLAINADGVLFNKDASGNIRLTLNKSAAAKDAGFVFQDNFGTRALFGLLGDDNFTVKVTPDGSTFYTGISIDKSTGKVSFPALAKVSAYINYDHYAATTYVNTDINNEDLDTANAFESNVFTAPTTGLYKVGYTIGWTQNGTNAPTSMHGRLLKNGTTEVFPSASRASNNAADTGKIIICTEGILALAAGDTLRLQHKFSSLDGYASANITRFWVEQIT